MLEILTTLTRETILDGAPFGDAGAYEQLAGRAVFAVDPATPLNARIVDLALAPRDTDGQVRCVADWWLMRPVEGARSSGTLLYNVLNRGNKNVLSTFQEGSIGNRPHRPEDFGDGFLFRRGVMLAAVAWQGDVLPGLGRMLFEAPVATGEHGRITGPVRMVVNLHRPSRTAPLGRPDLGFYPPLDLEEPGATLLVRDSPYAEPAVIPRDRWRFAVEDGGEPRPSPEHLWLADGFEPGRYYEVVYTAADPTVQGLGFAVTRDFVSFLRRTPTDAAGNANPAWNGDRSLVQHTVAYGASQSGRFLRHFLRDGFNEDEDGRRVFDGMMVHIAGAGVGGFNMRFAQPDRTRAHQNGVYPIEVFPFAGLPETDPHTGRTAGLYDRARERGVMPKVIETNTSAEYWGAAASLIHTDPLGTSDAAIAEDQQIYLIAGTQHVPGDFPPRDAGYMLQVPYPLGRHPGSPVLTRPVLRALFAALDAWLRDGTPPPPSAYPRLDNGTLASRDAVVEGFPSIAGVRVPEDWGVPRLLDYGPRCAEGILDREPPSLGAAYGPLVPAVDADGNELGGVRLPEVAVPLATYTGWNTRHPGIGNPEGMVAMLGSFFPFPTTDIAGSDPRMPIAERYRDRRDYLRRVEQVIDELLEGRLILQDDVPALLRRSEETWELLAGAAPSADAAVATREA